MWGSEDLKGPTEQARKALEARGGCCARWTLLGKWADLLRTEG